MDRIIHLNAARVVRFPASVRTEVSTKPIPNRLILTAITSVLTVIFPLPGTEVASSKSFLHSTIRAGSSRACNPARNTHAPNQPVFDTSGANCAPRPRTCRMHTRCSDDALRQATARSDVTDIVICSNIAAHANGSIIQDHRLQHALVPYEVPKSRVGSTPELGISTMFRIRGIRSA